MSDPAVTPTPPEGEQKLGRVGYSTWKCVFIGRTANGAFHGLTTLRGVHAAYPLVEQAWQRLESCARNNVELTTPHRFESFTMYSATPIADAA